MEASRFELKLYGTMKNGVLAVNGALCPPESVFLYTNTFIGHNAIYFVDVYGILTISSKSKIVFCS